MSGLHTVELPINLKEEQGILEHWSFQLWAWYIGIGNTLY